MTMAKLIVRTRDGAEHVIEADADGGQSVMEVIRDADIAELLALCGGCCSCATCHVHVGQDYLGLLPAVGDDEDALLDSLNHRDGASRLSCQVRFVPALDGMQVTIAKEE